MTCDCGEAMWIWSALDLAFDLDGLDRHQLIALCSRRGLAASVWACLDCGRWVG